MRQSNPGSKLKELVSKKNLPSCLVITAPDRTRRERAVRYVLEKHPAASQGTSTSFSFSDANRSHLENFLRDIREPSLFEQTRFAVLRDIDRPRAAEVEPLAKLLSDIPAGTHLIITGKTLPNIPTFKKLVSKSATHIHFEQLKGAELRRWLEREVKHHGISSIDEMTTELIQTIGNEDPDAISALLEKFALFLNGAPADRQSLQELEPGKTLASDFELAEVLLSNNNGNAQALVTKLLEQGSSPFMLIGLLTKTFGTLLQIRLLLEKRASHGDIKSLLGISPWLFSKYLPLAKRKTASEFSKALNELLVADFRLKDRSLGPTAIFSQLASHIAQEPVA